MKKHLSLFVATLATLFVTLTASAQGEWKWAHYWTGNGGNYSEIFNNVTNTAFDEEGNIYVYGTMGGNVSLDGEMLMFSSNSDVITTSKQSILLAKFDTLGTMLWYKVIKCNSDYWSIPKWMAVKNDRIYITGITGMWGDYNYWLYYIDTLITKADVLNLPESERKPPYKRSCWTFFSQLDLGGNRIEDHFVETYTREYYGYSHTRMVGPISTDEYAYPTPMHIDNEGNIYLFARFDYAGNEEEPYTVVIDGDSSKTYDLYLPRSSCSNSYLHNAMIYKFTPDWELEFAKLMVQTTEGIATSWELAHDSINPAYEVYPEWLSYDEEDNMYVSGFVKLSLSEYGASLHQYPIHIYYDSLHYATISDRSGTRRLNFVIKYNSDGDILWSNQIYTIGDLTGSAYCYAEWRGSCIDDDHLYLLGGAGYYSGASSNIYFDTESNYLQRFEPNGNIGFFAKFDKSSGQYVSQGIVPAFEPITSKIPAIIRNRVFAIASFNNSSNILLTEWRNDGLVIRNDTIYCSYLDAHHSFGVTTSDNGYLTLALLSYSPVSFGNNLVANCNNPGMSNAVFALYHNPEWTTPFVPDDSVGIDEYYQNREREIYLYPNPTDGRATVCGYMYGYTGIELYDLQGRKLGDLVETRHGTSLQSVPSSSLPVIDLSPYPSGTYLVKINFERGVSVVRKVVRM